MAIVFNTPKSALNTTSGAIQVKNGDNLQSKEVTINEEGEFTVKADNGYYGLSEVDITVDVPSDVHNQNVSVSPETTQQVITPEEGYTGLGEVTVGAVTSAIDNNITAGNIKKDVTILGVTGNFDPTPNLSNLNITPSTNAQEYNPAISGVDGYNIVSVAAVTSAIDANIQAENILDGVTILGVAGSNAGYDAGYAAGQATCPDTPVLDPLSVTPTTSAQHIYPEAGVADGFSDVSVAAVTSAIDQNILSNNIKNGVTILGVTGSFAGGSLQSKSITPTTSLQGVSPDSGYYGLDYVSVAAVTSAIDPNITAGNIKSGVSILGVTGSYDPQPNLESKSMGISVIGTQSAGPSQGYDGISSVSVTVNSAPSGSAGNPFDDSDTIDQATYTDAYATMVVDRVATQYEICIAVNANDNQFFKIKPFVVNVDDPNYDPEDESTWTYTYPNNFNIIDKTIVVHYLKSDVSVVNNVLTIDDCELISINGDSNTSTWFGAPIKMEYVDWYMNVGCESYQRIYSTEDWTATTTSKSSEFEFTEQGSAGLSNFYMRCNEEEEAEITITQKYSGETFTFTVNVTSDNMFHIININDASNDITFYKSANIGLDLSYKINTDGEWEQVQFETHPDDSNWEIAEWTLDPDDEIYFKGENYTLTSGVANGTDFCFFGSTGPVNTEGCLASLLDPINYDMYNGYQVLAPYAFDRLFSKQTIDGNDYELQIVFSGVILPNPATGSFANLYKDNDVLEECEDVTYSLAPYACYHMFDGCTNLMTCPIMPEEEVPLAPYCYAGMFKDCNMMEWKDGEPTQLPARYLEEGCYQQMFQGCENIFEAPQLPAQKLANSCYYEMFDGCVNLEDVWCGAEDISATNCTYNWLNNVAADGTIGVSSIAGFTTGASGTPANWTVNYIDM